MDKRIYYSWEQLNKDIINIAKLIKNYNISIIFGFPRGGLIPAVMLSNYSNIPLATHFSEIAHLRHDKILLIDDISDSGKTMLGIRDIEKYKTVTLYIKNQTKFVPNIYCHKCDNNIWLNFPWEKRNSLTEKDNTFKNV